MTDKGRRRWCFPARRLGSAVCRLWSYACLWRCWQAMAALSLLYVLGRRLFGTLPGFRCGRIEGSAGALAAARLLCLPV